MKVAWFTPFNEKSAIGDYSEAILTQLVQEHDVTVFAPAGGNIGEPRPSAVPVVPLPPHPPQDVIDSLASFDIAVYNLGNYIPYHQPIYAASLKHPGIVIMHDLVMRDFFRGLCYQARYIPDAYAKQLARDHGDEAGDHARALLNEGKLEQGEDPHRLRFPMFKSAIHGAYGVIVHSEYSRKRIAESCGVPVTKIDFPLYGPVRQFLDGLPEREPDPNGKVRILTFGVLNPNKLIHATIEAFGQSKLLRERAHFTIVGEGHDEYKKRLADLIERHKLHDVVTLAGYRTNDELRRELINADVVVALRNPHLGESSAVLLNSLVAGRATVVWNHGFYGEFPDDVVFKISAESELVGVLKQLVEHPERAAEVGNRARTHAMERFETGRYCAAFRTFVEEVRTQKPLMQLIDTVSQRLAELGSGPIDGLAEKLADEIADLWASDANVPQIQQ